MMSLRVTSGEVGSARIDPGGVERASVPQDVQVVNPHERSGPLPAAILTSPNRRTLQEAVDSGFEEQSPLLKAVASGEPLAPAPGLLTERETIKAAIDRIVASAPPLSQERRERLAETRA